MIVLPQLDSEITKNIIIDFVQEKILQAKSNGIVIGLSGGIDSSVVAYLSVEAIGKDNVFGVHMFSSSTPLEDKIHAKKIADLLGIEYKEINIDSIIKEAINIADYFDSNNKLAIGNLNARIRMSLLYYYANLKNYLVVGTGNKSELLIGYFTKFGDGGSDIEPIGDIYKSQLKSIAQYWDIPEDIINKPPRAALWENQSDEDELGMTYETLDKILYMAIDKNQDKETIFDNLEISLDKIDSVLNRVSNNQHKLQVPQSPKIM